MKPDDFLPSGNDTQRKKWWLAASSDCNQGIFWSVHDYKCNNEEKLTKV